MPLELLIVPIYLVLRHIDILRLERLLLAQFLAQLTEVMRCRIMLVQRVLVVKVHALAEMTLGVVLPDVLLIWLMLVHFLLKHQHWFEVQAQLTQGLPMDLLAMVVQLLNGLELPHRLLVAKPAYKG